MKNENIVRILLLSIGAFLVFIGLFGGIIASGDFLSGGFSVVVGILFLSFSHKMKEIIKEQTIEKNEDATIQNPDKENVIENKIDIDDLIKKSVNITGPTPPSKSKKADKKSPTYIKARKLVDDYVVIDFETTGLSPLDSEILQIGAIKYESNEEIDRIYQNIKPFRSNISKRITKITGLVDLSQYLGHILVETVKPFFLLLILQIPVGLDSESSYGFDFGYKILQCS